MKTILVIYDFGYELNVVIFNSYTDLELWLDSHGMAYDFIEIYEITKSVEISDVAELSRMERE